MAIQSNIIKQRPKFFLWPVHADAARWSILRPQFLFVIGAYVCVCDFLGWNGWNGWTAGIENIGDAIFSGAKCASYNLACLMK